MKTISTTLFGDVVEPEAFEELIAFCLDRNPRQGPAIRMWRGQADIEWPIHSAAYRRLALTTNPVTESDVQSYEEMLLGRATHRGFRRIDGKDISDFDLLARLQHHGAATRLVDFTRSVLIALWFAVAAEPAKTGALFGVHAHYIGGQEGIGEERNYAEIFEGLAAWDFPQTWEPPVITPRIAAQHSQFLYSDVVQRPTGSLKLPKDDRSFVVIALSPAAKEYFVKVLTETFDIRHLTLFPDLDGFSYSHSYRFEEWSNERW